MAKHAAKWLLPLPARALLCAFALAALLAAGCGGGSDAPAGPSIYEGTLIVTSTPTGARILVNDQDSGKQTPDEITREVQPGGTEFRVTVRLAGYEDSTTTVSVLPNEAVPVSFTLKQTLPPEIPPHTITGKVLLQSGSGTTPAASPTVVATETTTNESYTATVGAAGAYYIYAPAGTFRVTATAEGYQAQSREVTLVSGDDRRTGIDFTLPPG